MPARAQVAASPPSRIDARLPGKTGFLHLAQELQDQILEYILIQNEQVWICLGGWRGICMTHTAVRSLSAVSSKVRNDALNIFSSKNDFRLHFRDTSFDDCFMPLPKRPCCCSMLLGRVKHAYVVPFHRDDNRAFFIGKRDGKWFANRGRPYGSVDGHGRRLLQELRSREAAVSETGITKSEFEFIRSALWVM